MNAVHRLDPEHALPCVLFVDDDAGNRQAFQSTFRGHMRVLLAKDAHEVWAHLAANHVHVVIADQRMPDTRGCELLAQVRDRHPEVQRMLITAYADIEAVIEAINVARVTQYITKPWDAQAILDAVQRAHADVLKEEERKAYTDKLLEANRQLEFALRQRLLS